MYLIRDTISYIMMNIFKVLPLKDKAVFISFFGQSYSDNPKVMYEEMKKKYPQIEYVWIMKDPDSVKIDGAKVVKAKSLKAAYHYATSKLWISNSRLRGKMAKRKKQFYVQTWHGVACLKKVEKEAENKLSKSYIKDAKRDSKMANLFLSGSKFRTENYRKAFWYDGEILEFGLPKEDVFYGDKTEVKRKVREHFGISNDCKIVLYVPTFRVNKTTDCYDLDYQGLLNTLKNKWYNEWKILVRLHPNVSYKQNEIKYNEDIINATNYNFTNDLIAASDIVITDYSGCMFSALESNIISMIYASDYDEYMKDRGTYFDLKNMPCPLSESNKELQKRIEEFDEMEYFEKANALKQEVGFFENPHSTEQVVANIMNRINWGK